MERLFSQNPQPIIPTGTPHSTSGSYMLSVSFSQIDGLSDVSALIRPGMDESDDANVHQLIHSPDCLSTKLVPPAVVPPKRTATSTGNATVVFLTPG